MIQRCVVTLYIFFINYNTVLCLIMLFYVLLCCFVLLHIAELKTTTRGAIMHDEWSRCGVHYLRYFACYIFQNHPKSRLISLAPTANKEANETTETTMEDATHFNSETHNTHFITIMKDIYEIDVITWGRASIADNTNANLKTARLLKIPHVGCCNQKFNLDMKNMIEKVSLDNTISDIKQTMIHAKELKKLSYIENIDGSIARDPQ